MYRNVLVNELLDGSGTVSIGMYKGFVAVKSNLKSLSKGRRKNGTE